MCICLFIVLTLAPLGGEGYENPYGFSQIAPEVLANFALKLAIPLRATIPHLVSKN